MSTKDKILEVVVDFIKSRTPIESITLSKVAKQADIGKSTVYEHFSNKEEMIKETYQFLLDEYSKILFEDISETTFKEALFKQLNHILIVMKEATVIRDAIWNSQLDILWIVRHN